MSETPLVRQIGAFVERQRSDWHATRYHRAVARAAFRALLADLLRLGK